MIHSTYSTVRKNYYLPQRRCSTLFLSLRLPRSGRTFALWKYCTAGIVLHTWHGNSNYVCESFRNLEKRSALCRSTRLRVLYNSRSSRTKNYGEMSVKRRTIIPLFYKFLFSFNERTFWANGRLRDVHGDQHFITDVTKIHLQKIDCPTRAPRCRHQPTSRQPPLTV